MMMMFSLAELFVTLGILLQIVTLASAKAIIDQKAEETHNSNVQEQTGGAQKRIGYDYPAPALPISFDEHHHHEEPLVDNLQVQPLVDPHLHHVEPVIEEHHHEEHHPDPGFWKKKLIWKEGWKKIWKPGKKQIWKPDWKKIWKPIWVPTQIPVWKDIQVG
ncbi:AAEL012533-PA [Aedes aegypti]|uniref:AAEL012533-PA n=1 Tax=Aedes aegypti TaxID=7159 RepID=Q16LU0_AEDAE|nr:AAEL012533-PA [Aedes aegypti]